MNGHFGNVTLELNDANGTPIVSSATFLNRNPAELGFTAPGLIGTWTLRHTTTHDWIKVVVSSVPGPLPLLGAAAAFGWLISRPPRSGMGHPSVSLNVGFDDMANAAAARGGLISGISPSHRWFRHRRSRAPWR
jgi:hypothetical protein